MKSARRRFVSTVVVTVAIAVGYRALAAGIVPKDITTPGITPAVLANALVGAGVTISNVTFKGEARAAGIFTSGSASVVFEAGFVLRIGPILDFAGPSQSNCTHTYATASHD